MIAVALLNWRDARHWSDTPAPCGICDKPTHLRSERGKPVHKVCAEAWIDAHPGHTEDASRRDGGRR